MIFPCHADTGEGVSGVLQSPVRVINRDSTLDTTKLAEPVAAPQKTRAEVALRQGGAVTSALHNPSTKGQTHG